MELDSDVRLIKVVNSSGVHTAVTTMLLPTLNITVLVFIVTNVTYIYLRRQQERDLMQKARHLTDENSVSFQMFLILLSSITLCSESQTPMFKEGQSNT